MNIFNTVLVFCAIAIILFLFLVQRSNGKKRKLRALIDRRNRERRRQMPIDATPDSPVGFGYKISWLAVRADSPSNVAAALQLKSIEVANWKSGIARAYDDLIFVTPQVGPWVFVVSSDIPEPSCDSERPGYQMMVRLSTQFGECQFFGSHRIVGYAAWSRFVNGNELRTYSYVGESGEVIADRGEVTPPEIDLGFTNSPSSASQESSYESNESADGPSEEDVLVVARAWSIDPTTLGSLGPIASTGLVGKFANAKQQ